MTEITSVSGRAGHSPAPTQTAPVPSPLCGPRPRGGGDPQRHAAPLPLQMQRRLIRSAGILCFLVISLFAIFSASASAARHPAEGPFGTAAQPSFGRALGMAVDADGNLLVIDIANQTVSRFHPDGTPANFTALGTNVIDGQSGPDETPQGRVVPDALSGNANEYGVAVDTSGGMADGNIYVTNRADKVVSVFAESGEYLEQLGEFGGLPFGEVCGVTVDDDGAVYIGDYDNGVHKFVPSSNPVTNTDYTATFTSVSHPVALAAGRGPTANSLFVDSYDEGTITKIGRSTGEVEDIVTETATPASPVLPAVDPTTGHVYIGQETTTYEFDASSEDATRVSTITGSVAIEGVAVSGTSGQIYLGRKGEDHVSVYGSLAPPTPFIESQGVDSVGSTEAAVEAQINPEGSATEVKVEYGLTDAYGDSTPAEAIGGDETSHAIRSRIGNLFPGTEYHFRFVATNAVGVSAGPDRTFRTTDSGSSTEACSNQVLRVGPSARLSNCRAYEMVSPIDKRGLNIEPPLTLGAFRAVINQASTSGDRLTYSTAQGFGSTEGGSYARQYLATRTGSGWQSGSIAGPQNPSRYPGSNRIDMEYRIFSPDLCTGALLNWSEPALAPLAVEGAPNIYSRDLCGGATALSAVSVADHAVEPEVGGITDDGKCVVYFYNPFDFGKRKGELGGEGEVGGIYRVCGSTVNRVDVLPDGTPSEGHAVPGSPASNLISESMPRLGLMGSSVSRDGSTIYWTDSDVSTDAGKGQLFVRVNADEPESAIGSGGDCLEPTKACTITVSPPLSVSGGQVVFASASGDGSRAYFYFRRGALSGNLYEFDLASRSSRLIATGTPTELTSTTELAVVMGTSRDGSRLYFFSTDQLGGEGISNQLNLYLFEADSGTTGSTRLVASMPVKGNSGIQELSAAQLPFYRAARVTPDGRHAVFTTTEAVTGYDNRAADTGNPAMEVYAYDALADGGAGHLDCVSCHPTGQRPDAKRFLLLKQGEAGEVVYSKAEYAAVIPGFYTTFQAPRAITDDGSRVFFESFDNLVPRDSNGKGDVYEWVRAGFGGCTVQSAAYSPVNGGCLALVSTGQSPVDSTLIDATADGRDVFISTAQSLVPQDPGLVDIYDARAGGGFAAPSAPRVACESEACQPVPPAAAPQQSGSASFAGPGNPHRKKCRKGKKKPCQRHAKAKKQGKKKSHGAGRGHGQKKGGSK